jgi:hypothetical protein
LTCGKVNNNPAINLTATKNVQHPLLLDCMISDFVRDCADLLAGSNPLSVEKGSPPG